MFTSGNDFGGSDTIIMNKRIIAIVYAVLAALFYAINVPCSKVLLNDVAPTFMAGFLYIGAGLGVGVMYLFHFTKEPVEKRLKKEDTIYTVAMVLLDIAAPILLMIGIKMGSAANASLLGNFEIVATTLIAFVVFKEAISMRLGVAIVFVTLASMILSFSGTNSFDFSIGSLLVLGATVCWGIENNCTRKISDKSTYQIVVIKGICSGLGSVFIAMVIGETVPSLHKILLIMVLGYVAYGLSIFSYVRAQQILGAAKTSTYYAIAPFIGVLLSVILLKEKVTLSFAIALVVMMIGTILSVRDTLIFKHRHTHTHTITHTHDGSTHTHVIEHSSDHEHVIHDDVHGHHHPLEMLEKELNHGGTREIQ